MKNMVRFEDCDVVMTGFIWEYLFNNKWIVLNNSIIYEYFVDIRRPSAIMHFYEAELKKNYLKFIDYRVHDGNVEVSHDCFKSMLKKYGSAEDVQNYINIKKCTSIVREQIKYRHVDSETDMLLGCSMFEDDNKSNSYLYDKYIQIKNYIMSYFHK